MEGFFLNKIEIKKFMIQSNSISFTLNSLDSFIFFYFLKITKTKQTKNNLI